MRALTAVALGLALAGCGGAGDTTAAPRDGASGSPRAATAALGPPVASSVPSGALLSPADLGPGWASSLPAPPPCPSPSVGTASRSAGLTERRGTLTQTVAAGVDVSAAVASWRAALSRCGYAVRDDALGDASVSGSSPAGGDAVTVTGTEGVLVVLHARGALAAADDELQGWADLALGTSCVAAPDGCH